MNWRRWFGRPEPTLAAHAAGIPSPHRFTSDTAWLRAWVQHRLAAEPAAERRGPFGRGLPLHGSLDLDSVLAEDGTIWLQVFVPGGPAAPWREATREEAVSLFISAAPRLPALVRMIPRRPDDARDCPTCLGTGRHPGTPFHCQPCGQRGWLAPGYGASTWTAASETT